MDDIIRLLADNPVYLAVAVVLALIIVIGFIKKLFKMVLLVIAILILYIAYMYYVLDKSPDEIKDELEHIPGIIKEKGNEIIESGKEKVGEALE